MRHHFIPFEDAQTAEAARQIAPWAAEILRVEGGWHAFESIEDAWKWARQA